LLLPGTRYGPMARQLVALALGAKEAAEAMLATSALIASLGDGRLTGEDLGQALSEATRFLPMNYARWARNLRQAAQTGPHHARAIFRAIEVVIESGRTGHGSGFQKLLELTAVQNRQKSNDPRCKRGLCVPGTGILRLRSAAVS